MNQNNIKNKIKLIVYDCDGVLTDNRVLVDEKGKESVFFNRSDGLAIKLIKKMGINQVIISTEKNSIVQRRAEKLKIDCIFGVSDKKSVLTKYCETNKIELSHTIFIGNDINDLSVMQIVGIPICPNDAYKQIRNISQIVLETKGGYGCVRELLDLLQHTNTNNE